LVRKGGAKGDAVAQVTLGTIFHDGLGVAQNPERAVWWFLQAAKQGHAGAQAMIGVASHLGIGIEADRLHAVRMLMLSAAQRDPIAKAYLPTVYAELTPDERLLLEEWLRKAGAIA
jgi:TPR repeat protein